MDKPQIYYTKWKDQTQKNLYDSIYMKSPEKATTEK